MAKLNRKTFIAAAVLGLVAATGAQAQVSDDAVRIGVMADMTGPYAANGGPGSLLAVRMAVEDFGGKVLGKPIEVVVADDQNKPDVGTNIGKQWVDVEKVDPAVEAKPAPVTVFFLQVGAFQKAAGAPIRLDTLDQSLPYLFRRSMKTKLRSLRNESCSACRTERKKTLAEVTGSSR